MSADPMPARPLNRLSGAELLERRIELIDVLAGLEALRRVPPDPLHRYEERLGLALSSLALVEFALDGDRAAIRQGLGAAATHLTNALMSRPLPQDEELRNPHESEFFLAVIGAFGTPAERRRCATLRENQWRWPAVAAHSTLSAYLGRLLAFFGGETVDGDALQGLARRCDAVRATREDRLLLRPALAALASLGRGDGPALDLAIAQLLAVHAQEAMGGELRYRAEGLMCMQGMMWARFGLERDLPCCVDADHLPLDLLLEDRT